MIARVASLALVAALSVTAVGAPAQAPRRERYIQLTDDEQRCPPSTSDEIIVCGKVAESERFRIPEELRSAAPADAVSQAARVDQMVAIGRTGTESCSPVGPGGHTGCVARQAQEGRDEQAAVKRRRREQVR